MTGAEPPRAAGEKDEAGGNQRPLGQVSWLWLAPALLAIAVGLWLQLQPPQRELFLALNHGARMLNPVWWSSITLLGETGVVFCLAAPLLLWRPQMMFAVLAAVPVGGLLSVSSKALFQAPRPASLIDPAQFTVIGPVLHNASFPSGHSLTAFAAAVAIVVVVLTTPWRRQVGGFRRAGVALCALVLLGAAAFAGFSRIAVGAHWPADVLAGAGCGWLAGWSGAWLTARYPKLWQSTGAQMALGQVLLCTAGWLVLRRPEYPLGFGVVVGAAMLMVLTVALQFIQMFRRLRRVKAPVDNT